LKKSITYINLYQQEYFIFIILLLLLITSCNSTKYVPSGESLLNENHINVNKEGVKKSDLVPYLKQTPNKRIFGARFYLGLYNLSNINKEKWPHNWLRNIGEEPVIYDSDAKNKTKEQMKSYVASKGYFDGQVTDTVVTANRKSDVFYNVDLLRPYTIRNLTYEIADSNIKKLCYFDSVNCVIVRGKPYDVDVLQAERTRFERFIRDHGFYGFSNDYISFKVDSTVGNRQVDIKYIVRNFTKLDSYNRISSGPFAVYTVKNVYIYPDFVPKEALEGGDAYLKSLDTTFYKGYYFITSKKSQEVKYDLIIRSLYLKSGSVYNVTSTEETQAHMLALKIYRLVNINYNDAKENESLQGLELKLNCNIQLTLLSQQSYKIELEGTNSAGNLGGALNLIYQHKNLFHGAELFSTKLKGAYAAYSQPGSTLSNTQEYGLETSLRLPEFLVPFIKTENFVKKYNPSTTLLASYDYQSLPFYTRTIANASFGYDWKSGFYKEHIVNPIQLSLVKVPYIDPNYRKTILRSSYLAHSYDDVLIFGGSYSFIFNNQKIKNSHDYWFLRVNAESAGNFLSAVYKISGAKKTGPIVTDTIISQDTTKAYRLLGQPFAQYVKADIDIRYNYKFNDVSSIAYRGFFGICIPYGNSRAIPFEKQYFSGGANDIRAWQVRSLGPGSYADTSKLLNETGDIKLEANAEYRYKLFWIIEGAIFLDAGNIWSYNYDPSRPGSQFRFNKFYKDIAVGTGTGFRFDLKFVIARVDIGMKLRDPLLHDALFTEKSHWIFLNGPYRRKDFAIVLGIGYPF
jgi:outer membrane translocation and assembly module TamA